MQTSTAPVVPDDPQEILRQLHTEPARRDPLAFHDRLRELAPVHQDRDSGLWMLSRWADCNRVLRSDRFGQGGRMKQDPRYERSSSLRLLGDGLTGMDPPEHTRVRMMAMKGLSRAGVEGIRGYLHELTTHMLDELEDKPQFDLVNDYAARIPSTVICELLGLPREDHARFEAWIQDQFRILSPMAPSDEVLADTDRSVDALEAYLNDIIEQRRHAPKDDLISAFVATDEAAGEKMTAREALLLTVVLLGGGSDTSKSVITLGTRTLLQHPDELRGLMADPSQDGRAFEELIRIAGPVIIANPRISWDDIEIGGHQIPAGDLVAAVLISANFDPSVFEDPHRLDLGRSPNPHLSFGHGAHICAGNMLARMVVMHAITALLRRFPDLELLEDTFTPRLDLFALRGVKSLQVRRR